MMRKRWFLWCKYYPVWLPFRLWHTLMALCSSSLSLNCKNNIHQISRAMFKIFVHRSARTQIHSSTYLPALWHKFCSIHCHTSEIGETRASLLSWLLISRYTSQPEDLLLLALLSDEELSILHIPENSGLLFGDDDLRLPLLLLLLTVAMSLLRILCLSEWLRWFHSGFGLTLSTLSLEFEVHFWSRSSVWLCVDTAAS